MAAIEPSGFWADSHCSWLLWSRSWRRWCLPMAIRAQRRPWLPLHQVRQLMHRILQVLEIRVPSESSLRIRHVLRGRPLRKRLPNSNRRAGIGRDPSIPLSDMVTQSTAPIQAVADAMRVAADQDVTELIKLTPHRVMRELYSQTVAYWRAYADRVPNTMPKDDHLAAVANSTSATLVWVCSAITYGSAAARTAIGGRGRAASQVALVTRQIRALLESPYQSVSNGHNVSQFNAARLMARRSIPICLQVNGLQINRFYSLTS